MTLDDLRRAYRETEPPRNLTRTAIARFETASLRRRSLWPRTAAALAAVGVIVVGVTMLMKPPLPSPSPLSLSNLRSPAAMRPDIAMPTLGALSIVSLPSIRQPKPINPEEKGT